LPFEERFAAFFDPIVVLLFSALLLFRLHFAGLLGLWGMLAGIAFFALQVKAYSHGEAEFRGSLGQMASANARGEVSAMSSKHAPMTSDNKEVQAPSQPAWTITHVGNCSA